VCRKTKEPRIDSDMGTGLSHLIGRKKPRCTPKYRHLAVPFTRVPRKRHDRRVLQTLIGRSVLGRRVEEWTIAYRASRLPFSFLGSSTGDARVLHFVPYRSWPYCLGSVHCLPPILHAGFGVKSSRRECLTG
jgi:hypothetical protein